MLRQVVFVTIALAFVGLVHSRSMCPLQILCMDIYQPVCGADGTTYSNACWLRSTSCGRIEKVHDGPCEAECPRMGVCTMDYTPVCGTDGVTYGNECSLNLNTCSGVAKAYDGECTVTECPMLGACTDEYFPVCGTDGVTYPNQCNLDLNSCSGVAKSYDGECTVNNDTECPRMGACTFDYTPVCGTDGITYPNQCSLDLNSCSGVEKSYEGECQDFCPIAYDCLYEYSPVCGADGQTYTNWCYLMSAHCNKVAKAYDGPCEGDVTDTLECPRMGVCTDDYTPVCGTDGKTYANECGLSLASCSGVSKAHDGECTVTDTLECPRMGVCTDDYTPVCGTDGVTYANECGLNLASCSGVSKAHDGKCEVTEAVECPRMGVCTDDYTPVCGTDGVTYANECGLNLASCSGVSKAHDGECAIF